MATMGGISTGYGASFDTAYAWDWVGLGGRGHGRAGVQNRDLTVVAMFSWGQWEAGSKGSLPGRSDMMLTMYYMKQSKVGFE